MLIIKLHSTDKPIEQSQYLLMKLIEGAVPHTAVEDSIDVNVEALS